MSFAAVAVVGAAAVGGAMSADSSRKAAHTQADAANKATAAQQQQFDKQLELQQPWMDTGHQGLNVLSQYLGLTTPQQAHAQANADSQVFDEQAYLAANPDVAKAVAYEKTRGNNYTGKDHYEQFGRNEGRQASYLNGGTAPGTVGPAVAPVIGDSQFGSLLKPFGIEDFQKDPGYEFRMNEGAKTLQSGAAARGGLFSGGAGKALERYGQDYASNEYGKANDRYVSNQANTFNRLASVAGIGQTAANQSGAASQNFGNQVGSNIIGAGNANAAGQVGQANAWSNAIGQGYNAYQNNELMKRLQAPSSSNSGWATGGGGGFGTGSQYGNQDYGQFL
jgi:hypothetical protein